MLTRDRALAIAQVLIIVLSVIAIGATPGASTASDEQVSVDTPSPEPFNTDLGDQQSLQDAEETETVVIRLTEADIPSSADGQEVINILQDHAAQTQQPALAFADERDAVVVKERFWLSNAILVEVDTDKVPVSQLTDIEHVRTVHENFQVEVLDDQAAGNTGSAGASTAAVTEENTTYGLNQTNVTDVWEEYDTKGEGVRLAILDTGVDPDHQDLEIDPSNWAEFDENAAQVDSEPHDDHGHGTHVSGIATGGNASGTAIGVAPDATLMVGKVLNEDGMGTFSQILAGMEWAVVNDADVMSMSLGSSGYNEEMIDPVRNAENAGVVVVASIGNGGPGTSGSPGNVFETIGVGATNENQSVTSWSSGETIDTADDWGGAAPSDWPDTYVKPDLVAPGVDVISATPGEDEYAEFDGTSMAAPHVAGTVVLMESAASKHAENNPSVSMVKKALATTAIDLSEPETRQGAGFVDAKGATDHLVEDTNVSVRLDDDFPRHLEAGENGTATFRVSNVEYVTVNLTAESDADPADVTVYVNGQEASVGENVSVSEGSTDDFTVTVKTTETYVDRLEPEIKFENPSATSPMASTVYPPFFTPMRVHPDPLQAGDSADRFNGTDPVTNATEYAAEGTTVHIEAGTYENGLTATDVEPDITVTAAPGAEVTLKEDGYTPGLLVGEGMTLSDIRLEDNRSDGDASTAFHEDVGLVIEADGVTVENVEIRNVTSGAMVYETQGVSIRNTSVVTNSLDETIELGVSVWYSHNVEIVNTSVESEAYGFDLYASQDVVVEESNALATDGTGLMGVLLADSTVTESDLQATDGPAVAIAGSDNVYVSHNNIEGSNVSAGFTGAIVSEFNGLEFSSFGDDVSSLSSLETFRQETVEVGQDEVELLRLSYQSKSELQSLAMSAPEPLSDVRSEVLPDINASELEQMSEEELGSILEDNVTARQDGSNPDYHELTFEEIREEIDAEPVVYENNSIEGEAAGVVSITELAVYRDNEITNISYPHYGVFIGGSLLKLEGNHIDHTPRTGLKTEAGVDSFLGLTFMEDNYINATRGVSHPWYTFFSITWSEDNEIHAEDAFVNKGLITEMIIRGGDEPHAEYGIRSGAFAITQVMYTDFSETETAIYAESQSFFFEDEIGAIPVIAPLNYYGTERGPAVGDHLEIDEEPNVLQESGYDLPPGVFYDPFLTAPVEEVSTELDETQQFATDVSMEPGATYAFGVPGPVEGTIGEMFSDFDGVVYTFDASAQEWSQATGDEELAALEAVVVVPETEARAVIEFQAYGGPSVPPTTDLTEGWNFIGAAEYGAAEHAYASSADPARIVKLYDEPQQQGRTGDDFGTYTFGADSDGPDVSAMSGYFVYVEDDGSLAANLPPGASVDDFFELTGAYISGVFVDTESSESGSSSSTEDDDSTNQTEAVTTEGISQSASIAAL